MSDTSNHSSAESQSILILYGDPPSMVLRDLSGRIISAGFTLTRENQTSFEAALRSALATYFGEHLDISKARLVRIRDADAFIKRVKHENVSHLIYYGHALVGSNTLLPSMGKSISTWQIVDALKKNKAVKHFDLLGCSTVSLAAELSTDLPRVRMGYLRIARQDNIEVDRVTLRVKGIKIDPTPLFHFGGKP